jgi:hypothetical protein
MEGSGTTTASPYYTAESFELRPRVHREKTSPRPQQQHMRESTPSETRNGRDQLASTRSEHVMTTDGRRSNNVVADAIYIFCTRLSNAKQCQKVCRVTL